MLYHKIRWILSLIIMLITFSCNKPTEVPLIDTEIKIPGVGSKFFYMDKSIYKDSVIKNVPKIDSLADIGGYLGKDSCYKYINLKDAYEKIYSYKNSDGFGFYIDKYNASENPGWLELPNNQSRVFNYKRLDTSLKYGGLPTVLQMNGECYFVKDTIYSFGSKVMSVKQYKAKLWTHVENQIIKSDDTTFFTYLLSKDYNKILSTKVTNTIQKDRVDLVELHNAEIK